MKKLNWKFLLFASWLFFSATAESAIIYDTGPGGVNSGGYAVLDQQFIASKFNVDDTLTISSIEFWLGGGPSKTATIVLYKDDGFFLGLSAPGTELLSQEFVVQPPDNGQPSWYAKWSGLSNLAWQITAGSYWVALEVRPGQTLDGVMASFYQPGDGVDDGRHNPAPSTEFAIKTNNGNPQFDNQWRSCLGCNMAFGTRISEVPTPPAVWLFGSALGLMGVMRRKVIA